jgi:hypothetical protein
MVRVRNIGLESEIESEIESEMEIFLLFSLSILWSSFFTWLLSTVRVGVGVS